MAVRLADHEVRLLDARLFWRKLIMLVVFFGLFIPLKLYQERLLYWYVVFLIVLHVYILFVFLYRVRWRVLAGNRRAFALRLVAIAIFVVLLTLIKVGVTVWELVIFVGVSGVIHVALLLSLTVQVQPAKAVPVQVEA